MKILYLPKQDHTAAINATTILLNNGKKYNILINTAAIFIGNTQYPNTHKL